MLIPGDPAWPLALDTLGATQPLAPWVRGNADLLTQPLHRNGW